MNERAHKYWLGMARGTGGAILFSLPLLMTMELWWLGFSTSGVRIALLLVVAAPLLVGLSHYSGLRDTGSWLADVEDAASAYGIGIVTSAAVLLIFGVLDPRDGARDIVGKIALETLPAALGATLAHSQLAQSDSSDSGTHDRRKRDVGYWGQLFLMGSGAIYLALSVAPTQEMVLIAFKMDTTRAIGLAAMSLLVLHAFTYALHFRGQEPTPPNTPWWSLFLRFTIAGYVVVLALSAYILWTFGRFDGTAPVWMVTESIVLGFPASVGAAVARLVL